MAQKIKFANLEAKKDCIEKNDRTQMVQVIKV